MTDQTDALRELLERALELEGKADDTLEAEASDEIALQLAAEPEPETATVEALAAKVAELEDLVFALSVSEPEVKALDDDEDNEDDEPVGMDFEEYDEVKAAGWSPCPACGSREVDEYADGTARCEDCGSPLSGSAGVEPLGERNSSLVDRTGFNEGKDFDELEYDDDDGVEVKALDDEEDTEDIAALLARRAELGH